MLRAIDPLRLNWLWRLMCEVGDITASDIFNALNNAGIPISRERAEGWLSTEDQENYFPLTISEIEQNLRALQLLRHAGVQTATAAGDATPDPNDNDPV
jgi:hypothetical protein